jgi:hypothetical protein
VEAVTKVQLPRLHVAVGVPWYPKAQVPVQSVPLSAGKPQSPHCMLVRLAGGLAHGLGPARAEAHDQLAGANEEDGHVPRRNARSLPHLPTALPKSRDMASVSLTRCCALRCISRGRNTHCRWC